MEGEARRLPQNKPNGDRLTAKQARPPFTNQQKGYPMPKSEKVTLTDLEALAAKYGWVLENDPDLNLTFAVDDRGRERAFAVTDTSRPGISAR